MEGRKIYYKLLIFVCYFEISYGYFDSDKICAPGVDSAGITVPKGDIYIEYGNPLEILCILNPEKTNLTASSLRFQPGNSYTNVVNKTTLRLYIPKPEISDNLYSCKLEENGNNRSVCANYVFVGTKPQPVNNFSCISYNWESLNCSWDPPKNPIKTTYRLSYFLPGKSNKKFFHCPQNLSNTQANYCIWNTTTTPPHRISFHVYNFIMNGSNILGYNITNYKKNHFAMVLPRKAENLLPVDSTPSSLLISWTHPIALVNFPAGIMNKVMYRSTWDDDWQEVDTSVVDNSTGKFVLNITGLKYAHTVYNIRVRLKSKSAPDIDEWWSEAASTTLRTKPTVPKMPPKTDIGSFDSVLLRSDDRNHRKIFIYWQQIPQMFENGENFGYNISSVEEIIDGVPVKRNNYTPFISKSFAVFEPMSFNTYIFKIISYNNQGVSKNFSTITVPSSAEIPAEPVSFSKIAYDHGIYELNWNPPNQYYLASKRNKIESYTIFWCNNKNDAPFQCNGLLNWTHVDNNITAKNITVAEDQIFQFAISANTHNSSSGMVWADCTMLPDQGRDKLENVWINNSGSTFMEINWKLECIHQKSIKGFEVTYCPVRGPQDFSCKNELKTEKMWTNFTSHSTSYKIDNLTPYTTYKVAVALITVKDSLIESDYVPGTTLEGAPEDKPNDLKAIHVTNSSITLSWKPPHILNGVLRNYRLYVNNSRTYEVDKEQATQYTVKDLLSYEIYTIRVVACTISCSNKSADLTIRTKVGIPGRVEDVTVAYSTSYLNVSWAPLKTKQGGNNDLYEVQIQTLASNNAVLNTTVHVYNNTKKGTRFELLTPGCQESNDSHEYIISVRALNKAEDSNKYYEGPWSRPVKGVCSVTVQGISYTLLAFLIFFGMFLLICTFLVLQCGWKRYKEMRNVSVKLPPQIVFRMNEIPNEGSDVSMDKDNETSRLSDGKGSPTITQETNITDSEVDAHERDDDGMNIGDSPRTKKCNGNGYSILVQPPFLNPNVFALPPIPESPPDSPITMHYSPDREPRSASNREPRAASNHANNNRSHYILRAS